MSIADFCRFDASSVFMETTSVHPCKTLRRAHDVKRGIDKTFINLHLLQPFVTALFTILKIVVFYTYDRTLRVY